jgi:uncharacterized membrane protein
MSYYHAVVDGLRIFSLVAGSLVIFVGIAAGPLKAREAGGRGHVARRMGEHVALGLEFFIGATILNLVINPTWGGGGNHNPDHSGAQARNALAETFSGGS